MRFIKSLSIMFLVSLLGMSGTSASAASFDCKKASTKIEHAICNHPELSKLDQEIAAAFKSLKIDGRYYEEIVEAQRTWINSEREESAYNFEQQRDFLLIGSALNSCSIDMEVEFSVCEADANIALESCMALENYTTLVMNRCGGSYLKALKIVDRVETNIWRTAHDDDQETLVLFDKAYSIWKDFLDADCAWQYSEYRDGTIRGQIWLGCTTGYYTSRIMKLNLENKF